MVQTIIAIVFDCDGTLCPDTTDMLLEITGLKKKKFWNAVSGMVNAGWDPPLAYTSLLCSLNRTQNLHVTTRTLKKVGSNVPFFNGVPNVFPELRKFVGEIPEFSEAGIKVEYYI